MTARRFFIFTLALLAFAPAARADINAEGAAKLKTLFSDYLQRQKDLNQAGGAQIEYDGAVTVEQAASYYAVTLPHAKITHPDGGVLNIGMVSINASPGAAAGEWKMAVAIPTPITMTDAAKKQIFSLAIGTQKASGVWDETLQAFSKLDAQYGDIAIQAGDGVFTAQIPSARMVNDMNKTADGRWSGEGSLTVSGLSGAIKEKSPANFKLGDFKMNLGVDRYDVSKMTAYIAKIQELTKSGKISDPAAAPEIAKALSDFILTSANGLRFDYGVSGFEASGTNPAANAPQAFKLDAAHLGMSLENMLGDKAGLSFKMGYNGFSMLPSPPGYEGVTPTGGNIDLRLTDIPVQQIGAAATNALQGAGQSPNMAPMAGFALMTKVPALLAQAGSTLTVSDTNVVGPDYRFDVNGSGKADMSAVTSFVGNFKGVFAGLDGLLARVKGVAADPKNPAAGEMQGVLNTLETLKTQGKQEGDKYIYDFQLTPQGQMLMNGQPMAGAAPPPPPTLAPAAPAAPH